METAKRVKNIRQASQTIGKEWEGVVSRPQGGASGFRKCPRNGMVNFSVSGWSKSSSSLLI